MRLVSLILIVFTLTACSSRTSLISEKPTSKDYWYCQKGAANPWDCSLEKPAELVQSQPKEKSEQSSEAVKPAEEVVISPKTRDFSETRVSPEVSIETKATAESVAEPTPLTIATPTNEVRAEPIVETTAGSAATADIKPVEIKVEQAGDWLIQLGAFSREAKADELIGELGLGTKLQANVNSKRWYQVVVTGFTTKQAALQESQSLKATYPQLQPWVRKLSR